MAQRAAARLVGGSAPATDGRRRDGARRPPAEERGLDPGRAGAASGRAEAASGRAGAASGEPAAPSMEPQAERALPARITRSGPGSADGRRPSGPGRARRRSEPAALDIDRDELERAGGRGRADRLERQLREAARAYEDDRLDEAQRRLRRLLSEAPTYSPARELAGLAAYHQGRWADALAQLQVFAELTGSTEQHPVMADCQRALRHWDEVERLWAELRAASPSAELVTEGRIVAAGALADQGQVLGAIELLARSFQPPQRPKPFHLRRMYALADLYERAGELARARELFRRVAAADPDFFDVTDRVRALG